MEKKHELNKMIQFKVTAPGKLILYGEHAVVYGKTAIAAGIDIRTSLEFKQLPDGDEVELLLPKVDLNLTVSLEKIKELLSLDSIDHNSSYNRVEKFVNTLSYSSTSQKSSLEAFFYLLINIAIKEQIEIKPFQIKLSTDLSVSSGLGSSASYSVCISACLLRWSHLQKNLHKTFDNNDLQCISNYAFDCEKILHGTPSGIDNSTCTFGSFIEFRKNDCSNVITAAKDMKILLVDTKVQRNTKRLVETLAKLKENYPTIVQPILDSIDQVSREAVKILDKTRTSPDSDNSNEYQQLMTLIEINQGLLVSCKVSHPSLDGICAEARKHSLAGKLTGAGGGGYAYILIPPNTKSETIVKISKKLIDDGYSVTPTTLGCTGVEIHQIQ